MKVDPNRSERWPLWRQIGIAVLLIALIAAFGFGELLRKVEYGYLRERLQERSRETIGVLAAVAIDAVITEDRPVLQEMATQIVSRQPDVHLLMIENEEGFPLAQARGVMGRFEHAPTVFEEEFLIESERFGTVRIEWNIDAAMSEIDRHIRAMRLYAALALLGLAALLILAVDLLAIRPIRRISERLSAFRPGEALPPIRLRAARELEILNRAVDELSDALARQRQQDQELTDARIQQVVSEERSESLRSANRELARAARLRQQLLANMSHELRTPLTTILAVAESAEDEYGGVMSADVSEACSTVRKSGMHLLDLINEVLTVARIEAGREQADRRIFSVKQTIDDAVEFVSVLAASRRQSIEVECKDDTLAVWADALHCRQIFVNLLANAIKFTPEGGKLGVTARAAGDCVELVVWDDGIGISPENWTRLFGAFQKGEEGLTQTREGVGLGLHIVLQLVSLNNGQVALEPGPDGGTRFTVRLPAKPEPEAEIEEDGTVADVPEIRPGPGSTTVLIAENDEGNRRIFQAYLKRRGFRVLVARDGLEALASVREARPDVVLMDIQMPGMHGLEATERIKADPQLKRTRIIGVSALALDIDRERALAAGCDLYLTKPVSLAQLVVEIARLAGQ